jgi:hypothetical protein
MYRYEITIDGKEYQTELDGITRKQADKILDIITDIAELLGTELGGGFWEVDDGEENIEQV